MSRLIQEELDKKKQEVKTSASSDKLNALISESLSGNRSVDAGELPVVDSLIGSREVAENDVDALVSADVQEGEKPGDYLREIERVEAAANDADEAVEALQEDGKQDAVAKFGARAAAEVQKAFETGKTDQLGSVVDKYLADAKGAGVDEATARAGLKEQVGLTHKTLLEASEAMAQAGMDTQAVRLKAQAAEVDSFSRTLEGDAIASEAANAFADDLAVGRITSLEQANGKIDELLKSKKIMGTEIRPLMKLVNERFPSGKSSESAGIDMDDSDIDSALDVFSDDRKAGS